MILYVGVLTFFRLVLLSLYIWRFIALSQDIWLLFLLNSSTIVASRIVLSFTSFTIFCTLFDEEWGSNPMIWWCLSRKWNVFMDASTLFIVIIIAYIIVIRLSFYIDWFRLCKWPLVLFFLFALFVNFISFLLILSPWIAYFLSSMGYFSLFLDSMIIYFPRNVRETEKLTVFYWVQRTVLSVARDCRQCRSHLFKIWSISLSIWIQVLLRVNICFLWF